MWEFVLALLLGVLFGTFTGIIPGIHINLVAATLIAFSALFLTWASPLSLAIFIVAMSITHTFVDFIPSIFLGAPDEDTALSILPGHSFLQEGKGYHALVYTLYGSISALPIILVFTPLFIFFLPQIYAFFSPVIFFILLLTSLFLIFTEKQGIIKALIVFLLAGLFGIASLNNNVQDPLLPMLSGLFGGSSLLLSIKKKVQIPVQEIVKLREIRMEKREIGRSFLSSFISAPLCSFLPAIGSGQAAVIGSTLVDGMNRKEFLFLLGAINTVVMGLSFVTLYSIAKSRTGSAVAVSKLLELSGSDLFLILLALLFASLLAFFLALYLGKFFARNISRIRYDFLSAFIFFILFIVVFSFSGFLGLLIFATGIFTGLVAMLFGVKRIYLMGCLLIPTLLIYWPF